MVRIVFGGSYPRGGSLKQVILSIVFYSDWFTISLEEYLESLGSFMNKFLCVDGGTKEDFDYG